MPPPSRAALNSSGANDDLIGDFETTLDEYTARSAGEIGHKYWCIRDGGIDHGPYHETYPGGAAALVGQFRDGEFHGTWTRWTEDGQLRAYEVYDGGELLRHGTCRGSPSPDFK